MFFTNKFKKFLLFVSLAVFCAVEIPIIAAGFFTTPLPSDVIIILGSRLIGRQPGPALKPRLDEGLRLYQQGYAPLIIVSGAQGADEEISEAAGMKDYLVSAGIPAEHILLEAASFNTYQNLLYSQTLMKEHGLQQAIIVSSTSHIRRSLLIAGSIGLEASGAPAPLPARPVTVMYQYLREGAANVSMVLTPPQPSSLSR